MKTLVCYPSDSSAYAASCRLIPVRTGSASIAPNGWTVHAVLDVVLPDDFTESFLALFRTLGISEACESYSDATLMRPLPASSHEVCILLTRALSDERYVRVPYTLTERIGNTDECAEFRRRIVNVRSI